MAEKEVQGKKQNQGHNIGDLVRRIGELEAKVAELSAPISDCAFCAGSGYEPTNKGKPRKDDNDNLVACRICGGRGKVRVK